MSAAEPVSSGAPAGVIAGAEGRGGRRRRRRLILLIIGIVLLVLVAAVAWLGFRVIQVKDSLERAQGLIGDLQSQVASDPGSLVGTVGEITDATDQARAGSSDPVWRVAEIVPVLGRNLTVVRELVGTVDDLADNALEPLATVAGQLDSSAFSPVNGRIDLAPIADAAVSVAAADDAVQTARTTVNGIDADGTLEPVASARDQLVGVLGDAASLTSGLRAATQLLPPMLGADGPRNYVLMIQNNAEARALGGNPAALVLLTVDDGAISITGQGSSPDFRADRSLVPDPAIYDAYYPHFPSFITDITTRPDFPTAASLAKSFWEKYKGGTVDGVLSLDPVALSYLLKATGPVALITGDQLTSDNAISLLLSDVYARYEDPRLQDAFFASAAAEVFSAITSGNVDASALLAGLQKAGAERRLLLWSDREDEQSIIATTPIAGILPTSNDETTAVGVYFMDRSISKMDYYLDTSVTSASDQCTADQPTFTVSVTLTSAIDQATADSLPSYVASETFGGGTFQTDVYTLGPVGSTFEATDSPDAVISGGTDLGRPVVGLNVLLAPGESRTVELTFRGEPGAEYGPLATWTTPMVRPTLVSESTPGC
ncbi:DUF4012 domain-containing protein [Amnibacterium flavum]|uniref:DUF4012 domain-containing protein n=1 Tax=Amnibacterium flavum TaxID=2173173 RepID=UPI001057F499|nr:DUF4012 domain-containing protein [Amnibacterium flavum]